MFVKSEWIWLADGEQEDQYAEFADTVVFHGEDRITLRLSVDSDYTVFVNGSFFSAGQCSDYEHYKIYDELNLSPVLQSGENRLLILAYHNGATSCQRYRYGKAGLIYEIVNGQDDPLAFSSPATLSRLSPAYESGRKMPVTVQLGYTFLYDANREREDGFLPSVTVDKPHTLFPRSIAKSVIGERRPMKTVTKTDGCHHLIDLGSEVVGVPSLELRSQTAQTVTVAWGEHLIDGGVRKEFEPGNRHFYYQYRTRVGENCFDNYMLHLGCRYIEVFSEEPIELIYAGVRPDVYKTNPRPYRLEREQDQEIYRACLRTLNLCMMDHYVDCPWREQALYIGDSRIQMKVGYAAFADLNAAYARASLQKICEDRRDDNLFSICQPCGLDLSIPANSLYFCLQMREYCEATGDLSLASQYFSKMTAAVDFFLQNRQNGLVLSFADKRYWNFYDWTPYSAGRIGVDGVPVPDLILNSLLILALDSLRQLAERTGNTFPYPTDLTDELRTLAHREFYTPAGVFTLRRGQDQCTVLCNALALLAKVAVGEEALRICEAIRNGELVDCSLSMKELEYEALLSVDPEASRNFILSEIRRNYQTMLDFGSDTVWETQAGAEDFHGQGSLCHGWSTVPIYIYHKFGMVSE